MPSVPSSPSIPSRHRRRSSRKPSNLDLDFSSSASHSAYSNGFSPSHSPQTPRSSFHSPSTPRQKNRDCISLANEADESADQPAHSTGGLGSLADELAEAWDDYGEEEGSSLAMVDSSAQLQTPGFVDDMHDFGIGGGIGLANSDSLNQMLSPNSLSPVQARTRKRGGKVHHSRTESQYDGSDYGNDSDLEDLGGMSAGLESKMAAIEALARRGTESNGSELDGVVKRTVISLKDLGNQSGVENSATRLITAYTSVTSHLAHQTRTLHTLTHPLLFAPATAFPPLALFPEEEIEEMISLVSTCLDDNLLPFPPSPSPLQPVQSLINHTSDLVQTLRTLSDTLNESRQTTSTAARRLKSAKELVTEVKREEDVKAEAERWIERGKWDERLGRRECAAVCGDVVRGFEKECGLWRERLVAMAGG